MGWLAPLTHTCHWPAEACTAGTGCAPARGHPGAPRGPGAPPGAVDWLAPLTHACHCLPKPARARQGLAAHLLGGILAHRGPQERLQRHGVAGAAGVGCAVARPPRQGVQGLRGAGEARALPAARCVSGPHWCLPHVMLGHQHSPGAAWPCPDGVPGLPPSCARRAFLWPAGWLAASWQLQAARSPIKMEPSASVKRAAGADRPSGPADPFYSTATWQPGGSTLLCVRSRHVSPRRPPHQHAQHHPAPGTLHQSPHHLSGAQAQVARSAQAASLAAGCSCLWGPCRGEQSPQAVCVGIKRYAAPQGAHQRCEQVGRAGHAVRRSSEGRALQAAQPASAAGCPRVLRWEGTGGPKAGGRRQLPLPALPLFRARICAGRRCRRLCRATVGVSAASCQAAGRGAPSAAGQHRSHSEPVPRPLPACQSSRPAHRPCARAQEVCWRTGLRECATRVQARPRAPGRCMSARPPGPGRWHSAPRAAAPWGPGGRPGTGQRRAGSPAAESA